MYGFGHSNVGQLGMGSNIAKNAPQRIPGFVDKVATRIWTGFSHSFVRTDGRCWSYELTDAGCVSGAGLA